MDWGYNSSPRRRICMLMVTHACNLNCSYCYEAYKRNVYMNMELAKEIISREAQFVRESDDFDELEIDFMGGEPFMNFPLIKSVVEWLEENRINVPWVTFATTNGTLLSSEVKNWLREHRKSLVLGASYDGNSEMQSANRGTDRYNIDLTFFHELWPNQSLHMTISKETLPTFADGVINIQEQGYKLEAALAQDIDWSRKDAFTYREQLCRLKEYYLKNESVTPINRLARLVNIFDLPPMAEEQQRWCGTGKNMVTYDIDGKAYGCHMFTPLVVGEERALLTNSIKWDSPKLMVDNECGHCVLRRFCPTCPGFNYKVRGKLSIRDKRWCALVLAEALTACEFQIERIANIEKLDGEDAMHGKAALKSYHLLKCFDLENSKSPYTICQ